MFGSLGGILPLRLGGTAKNGWTAAQHARFVADLVACKRTLPIAQWRFNEATATISSYRGWNGAGPAHAPQVNDVTPGNMEFTWDDRAFADPYDAEVFRTIRVRAAIVMAETSGVWCDHQLLANGISVYAADEFGLNAVSSYSVALYGSVGESDRVGVEDYAGAADKVDNQSESKQPYAARVLAELRRSRGSAYTQRTGTLVHVENIALARLISWGAFRLPEKVRANALPGTSDEKLDYWTEVLRIPRRFDDKPSQVRERAAVQYQAVTGNAFPEVRAALEALFGDNLVGVVTLTGSSLSSPPINTFWDAGTPGSPDFDLGGGTWQSSRSLLGVGLSIPSDMAPADFERLVSEASSMLDRMLPAYMTFTIVY